MNEAEGYLKKAIEYDFTNANYHFLLGCIYDQIGDYIQAYREACYADEYFVADGQPSGLNVNFLNQNEIDHLKKGLEEFFKTDGEYHDIRTKEE